MIGKVLLTFNHFIQINPDAGMQIDGEPIEVVCMSLCGALLDYGDAMQPL